MTGRDSGGIAVGRAQLGVAVVGCGSTAHRRHLATWSTLDGCRLVAVVSRDADRRADAARMYGAAHAIADWRDLAGMPEVDIVDICTPHPTHAEIACALARAGKHILCEKPMAVTLAEAQAMTEAARAAGVVLLPFHNMRLLGAARAAIDLVRQGAVGRPLLIRGIMAHGGPDARDPRRQWFLEAGSGGGAVLDLGPHLFDLCAVLLPQPAQRLRATLRRGEGDAVERDAAVEMSCADGTAAHLLLSWSMVGGRETQIVVHGAEGVLRLALAQEPPPAEGGSLAPLALSRGGPGAVAVQYPAPAATLEPCALMLGAVRGGTVPLSAADGVSAIACVEAVYRSAALDGAWVAL